MRGMPSSRRSRRWWDRDQYSQGADHVDPNHWLAALEGVVSRIDRASPSPGSSPGRAASTKPRLEAILDSHRPTMRASSFGELIGHIGLTNRDQLLARYGDDRCDWRPFGSPMSILTLLNELRVHLGALRRAIPVETRQSRLLERIEGPGQRHRGPALRRACRHRAGPLVAVRRRSVRAVRPASGMHGKTTRLQLWCCRPSIWRCASTSATSWRWPSRSCSISTTGPGS